MWTAAVRTVNKANPAAFLFRTSLADCNTHGKIAKSRYISDYDYLLFVNFNLIRFKSAWPKG